MKHPGKPIAGSDTAGRPQVVFIGGYGRSGSTLLERILARIPGVVAVGELCFLWDRGVRDAELCGCGNPLPQCVFWSEVLRTAFGSDVHEKIAPVLRWQKATQGLRNLPQLRHPGLRRGEFSAALTNYRAMLARLFGAIHEVTGGALIVDSSKDPLHAEVLAGMGEIELRLIHLVRDSRAVAYSWQRKRRRPEVHWREEYMPRFSTLRCAAAWSVKNALVANLAERTTLQSLVRYEDLIDRPEHELARIIHQLQLPEAPGLLQQLSRHEVCLAADHTVAGNPLRFRTGELRLKKDEEWRRGMPRLRRQAITALTWPGLGRFGYREGERT